MLERALDVVFPPRCAGCGDGAWPFCERCRRSLRALSPPWCERCGAPSGEDTRSCGDCPPSSIACARAPFAFEGPARAAVHHLKYRGVRGVGRALAAAMATCAPPPADVVTWVPLDPPAAGRARLRPGPGPRRRARAGTRPSRARACSDESSRTDRRPNVTRQPGVPRCGRVRVRRGIRRPRTCCSWTTCSRPGRPRPPAPRRCWRPGSTDVSLVVGRTRALARRPTCLYSTGPLVRVCGCPGTIPGSRRQPRAKRPT